MFTPEKLLEPAIIETSFGNLTVTHRLQFVEKISPLDRVPCVLKTVFGIINASGVFEICPNAVPMFQTLDAPGFQAFISKSGGDFLLSALPPACDARGLELKAIRDAFMLKMKMETAARVTADVAANQAKQAAAKAAATPTPATPA